MGQDEASALIKAHQSGGDEAACKGALKSCFTGLVTRDESVVKQNLETLVGKLETLGELGVRLVSATTGTFNVYFCLQHVTEYSQYKLSNDTYLLKIKQQVLKI